MFEVRLRTRVAILGALLALTITMSCTVARTRKFIGEEKYNQIGRWQIGVPVIWALKRTSDRSMWNDSLYYPQVPFKLEPRDYATEWSVFQSGVLRIESIVIQMFHSEARFVQKARMYVDDSSGVPRILGNILQDYADESPLCFTFAPLTIPASEDSVQVEFTVDVRRDDGSALTGDFVFVLRRHESTYPTMWGGK